MKLDVVTQVYAVLRYSRFLWMIKPDVLMVLFDPASQWNTHFVQCWPYNICRGCCKCQLFPSQGWRKLASLLVGRLTVLILYLDCTLLMQLTVQQWGKEGHLSGGQVDCKHKGSVIPVVLFECLLPRDCTA